MRISAPVALVAAICFASLSLLGCQPAASTTNRQPATTAPTPEKIDPVTIEAELTRLERGWADASKNHDANAASQILADDVMLTYPDGTTGTKADELKVISSGALTADSWELVDPKVTVINAETALISGRTLIKNGKYKEGNSKPIDISGEYRFTDVYVKRNGKWQALASQATKIANPVPSPSPASPKVSPAGATSPVKPTP